MFKYIAWLILGSLILVPNAWAGLAADDVANAIRARNSSIIAVHIDAVGYDVGAHDVSASKIDALLSQADAAPSSAQTILEKFLTDSDVQKQLVPQVISSYQRHDKLYQLVTPQGQPPYSIALDSNSFRELVSTGANRSQLTVSPPASIANRGDVLTLDSLKLASAEIFSKPFNIVADGNGWRIEQKVDDDRSMTLYYNDRLELTHLISRDKSGIIVVERWYWGYHPIGNLSMPTGVFSWYGPGPLVFLRLYNLKHIDINPEISDKSLVLSLGPLQRLTLVDNRHQPPTVETFAPGQATDSIINDSIAQLNDLPPTTNPLTSNPPISAPLVTPSEEGTGNHLGFMIVAIIVGGIITVILVVYTRRHRRSI